LRRSIAGVPQTPAPAKSSSGLLGEWMVQVFRRTLPVSASRNTIEPWKFSRTDDSAVSSAIPPETPTMSTPLTRTGLA
jgi:hypothetical protein